MLVVCQKTKNKKQTTFANAKHGEQREAKHGEQREAKRRAAIPPIPEGMGFPPLSVNVELGIRNKLSIFVGAGNGKSYRILR
ncbi:MAG: hypothetical protein F6K47_07695 [Symploca sp. SIO2E6]|nr:hypothetical protein [Symploca sp. SIO2E6]